MHAGINAYLTEMQAALAGNASAVEGCEARPQRGIAGGAEGRLIPRAVDDLDLGLMV